MLTQPSHWLESLHTAVWSTRQTEGDVKQITVLSYHSQTLFQDDASTNFTFSHLSLQLEANMLLFCSNVTVVASGEFIFYL